MESTFLPEVVALWKKIIERSRKQKYEQFGKTADRAWAFLGKDYKSLYVDAVDDKGEQFAHIVEAGIWKTRRNLSRDYVATMLPYIHAKVPNRLVLPRRPGMPVELLRLAQQNPEIAPALNHATLLQKSLEPTDTLRAFLLKWWLNYLPSEYDLHSEQRRALPEALVKGRCVMWPEMVQSAYGLIPASYYDSIDGLLCDPDSRSWRDQGFIIRERCEHIIRTAEKFSTADHKIDPAELRGRFDSNYKTAAKGANLLPNNLAQTEDVAVYYEIYSRFGIGHQFNEAGLELREFKDSLDAIGNHVYLAIMPGVPYPLNLPPETIKNSSGDELKRRLAWPVPFHADLTDPWPCVPLDLLPNQNDPWATSPLEGSLPLLAFIDHGYCYMMEWLKNGCKSVWVGSKALGEKFVNSYLESLNMEYITLEGEPGIDLDKLLKRIDFPAVRRDLLMVIEKVERAFEQSSGMTPALQGEAPDKQDRSATATSARESRLSSRPNDFADCVEAWNSRIAAKESLATRLYVGKDVISPFFGEQDQEVPDPNLDPEILAMAERTGQEVPTITIPGPLTQKWLELVSVGDENMSQEELEQAAAEAAAELTYTVEAGSGKRKNKQKQVEDFTQLAQSFGQVWLQMGMTGNPGPYNWLMGLASDVFDRSMDGAMLPMPAPGAEQEQPPSPEEQQAAAEAQAAEQEMAIKQREAELKIAVQQQEMAMKDAQHKQEMHHREELHEQDMQMKKAQIEATRKAQSRIDNDV